MLAGDLLKQTPPFVKTMRLIGVTPIQKLTILVLWACEGSSSLYPPSCSELYCGSMSGRMNLVRGAERKLWRGYVRRFFSYRPNYHQYHFK